MRRTDRPFRFFLNLLRDQWAVIVIAFALGLMLVPAEAASVVVTETPSTEVACYRSTSVFHRALTKAECEARIREDAATRAPGTYSYGIQPGRDRVSVVVSAAPPPVVNADCVTERFGTPTESPVTGSCVGGSMLVNRTWPLRVTKPATGTGSCPSILQENEQVTRACTPPHEHPTSPDKPIPAPAVAGVSTLRVTTTSYAKTYQGNSGQFRVGCRYSHMAFDDPIVFPGQAGASHLHIFWGNTGSRFDSTTESLMTSGNGSCDGGIANRSSYWMPAVIDTSTNRAIPPSDIMVYYKSGWDIPLRNYPNLPTGLRMVIGKRQADWSKPTESETLIRIQCEGQTIRAVPNGMPVCAGGTKMLFMFESYPCWDGVNLDSPDHRSHMAPGRSRACPASHPVPLPVITQNVYYDVPAGSTSAAWRLSSDSYDASLPAGYSMHGDIWVAWNESISSAWMENCIRAGYDCHANLLGDGRALY